MEISRKTGREKGKIDKLRNKIALKKTLKTGLNDCCNK